MITRIFPLLQTFPSTALILFLPRLTLVLFRDISLFPFLGPIAGIGLFIPSAATWYKPCHINAKCEIQLSFRRSIITLYHIHAWERLGIGLAQ
jgi:hypothetical protein